jgi:hypothetical protein
VPLFEVVIYETVKHTFEVYARDETEAEGMAHEGFPVSNGFDDGIAFQDKETLDYEVQDNYTTYIGDDPESDDE